MKKIVSLLLVALLLACTAAYAELPEIDLASMSIDELVELHAAVEAEINSKNGSIPSPIYKGIYIVGESIAPGKYTITCPNDKSSFNVGIFADQDTYQKAFAEQDESLASFQCYVASGESTFVQLEDGMVLFLNGEGQIQQVNPDWAP